MNLSRLPAKARRATATTAGHVQAVTIATTARLGDWKEEWQERIWANAAKMEKTVFKKNRFVKPPTVAPPPPPKTYGDHFMERFRTASERAARYASKSKEVSIRERVRSYPIEQHVRLAKTSLIRSREMAKFGAREVRFAAETGYAYAKVHGRTGLEVGRTFYREGREFVRGRTPEGARKFTEELREGSSQEYEKIMAAIRVERMRREGRMEQITYQDLVAAYSVKRDLYKTLTFVAFGSLPFGSSLIALTSYLNPRKLLPQTFWSDEQHIAFLTHDHVERADAVKRVADHVAASRHNPMVMSRHGRVMEIVCDALKYGAVLSNEALLLMRDACQDEPLQISGSNLPVQRELCKAFGLSAVGGARHLTARLRAHALVLREMDAMLRTRGVNSLSDRELRAATFMRSLNANTFSREANQYWLESWLCVSEGCGKADTWFYYYAMILHSYHFNESVYKNNKFGLEPLAVQVEPPKQLEDGDLDHTTLVASPLENEAQPIAQAIQASVPEPITDASSSSAATTKTIDASK